MSAEYAIVTCPHCQQKNRVKIQHVFLRHVCGKCQGEIVFELINKAVVSAILDGRPEREFLAARPAPGVH